MTRQQLRVFFQEWFCGCGCPDEAAKELLAILRLCPLHSNRPEFEAYLPNVGLEMLLLYTLDHFGLIEHGCGIGGSWLTDKGRDVLVALEREEGDGFDELTQSACLHGYSVETDELLLCPECGPQNMRGGT